MKYNIYLFIYSSVLSKQGVDVSRLTLPSAVREVGKWLYKLVKSTTKVIIKYNSVVVASFCVENQVLLDCGAVQADALTVDRLASLEKVYKDVIPPSKS